MKVVAIIQARMGSKRLPGKVLMPVNGKPLLRRIIQALRKCERIDEVVIATTKSRYDDILGIGYSNYHGLGVYRGPSKNVLARMRGAAEKYEADVVVRVCGDAPFIDSGIVDLLVRFVSDPTLDLEYAYHESQAGIDVLRRDLLDRLPAKSSVAREHVTGYLKAHPDFADTLCLHGRLPERNSWSIDTQEDLDRCQALFSSSQTPTSATPQPSQPGSVSTA